MSRMPRAPESELYSIKCYTPMRIKAGSLKEVKGHPAHQVAAQYALHDSGRLKDWDLASHSLLYPATARAGPGMPAGSTVGVAYLKVPAANGGVVRRGRHNCVVCIDLQVCDLSLVAPAGCEQQSGLHTPDLCIQQTSALLTDPLQLSFNLLPP